VVYRGCGDIFELNKKRENLKIMGQAVDKKRKSRWEVKPDWAAKQRQKAGVANFTVTLDLKER